MKQGKSLTELAAEIQRQQDNKADYVADTRELTLATDGNHINVANHGDYSVSDHAHGQIASRLKIDKRYYDRLRADHPTLLAENVNHLFTHEPERRMVRTLDGRARAFVSDKFARLDNADMLEILLPVLGDIPCYELASMEITERRMYLKIVFPGMQREVKKVGDVIQAGALVSNSEIGCGSWDVSFLTKTLRCLNGMVGESVVKRHHVGRRLEASDGVIYAEDTLAADDRALQLKTRDALKAIVSGEYIDAYVGKLNLAATSSEVEQPVKAVEVLANRIGLNEGERDSVLTHLIQHGDLSKYGVANAVSRAAQDVDSYDRSTDMERLGHRVINLDAVEWNELRDAA